ncbi:hypothetical protein PCE1_003001 [Barthelona sp. PCE]
MQSVEETNEGDDRLPWVEKYRPKNFTDIVSQQWIIETLDRFLVKDQWPHLLFYGPPGVGKTSTINAACQMIYGTTSSPMILELNASDARGIDVVRNTIKDFASTRAMFSDKFKLVILDEVDSMTNTAQFALRRIIENYTKHARFCLICNEVSQIIPALQSRCTRFRFSPLEPALALEKAREIAVAEHMTFEDDALSILCDVAGGDMRRVLNVMQAISMTRVPLTEGSVFATMGRPHPNLVNELLQRLLQSDAIDGLQYLDENIIKQGFSLEDIVPLLHDLVLPVEMPSTQHALILTGLADIQYQLTQASTPSLQSAALVGLFQRMRSAV